MSRSIFLIGMPGAGKTTWGMKVAEAYGLEFLDLDLYIEQKHGGSIAALFSSFGENSFRQRETEALQEAIANHEKPMVLSCGGGTPVLQTNMEIMKANGCMVYLSANIKTLMENLKQHPGQRPLLNNVANPVTEVSMLYDKRRRVYEQADYTLQVEQLTISDFDPIVKACIKQH